MTDAVAQRPLLEARIDALFPHGEHQPPAVQLRRSIALWLAGSPRPEVGQCAALLTTLGSYLRQSQAHLWLDPDQRWPKLKAFLEDPGSQGAFQVQEVQDVAVRLNLRLLLPPAATSSSLPVPPAGADPALLTPAKVRQALHKAFRTLKTADGRPKDPGTMLSRHLGLWLSSSPFPDKLPDTPYAALLSDVGSYLAEGGGNPASRMWCDAAYKWPRLRVFLTAPERGGCFGVAVREGHTGDDLVQLDVEAVLARAAAEEASARAVSSNSSRASAVAGAGASTSSSKRQAGVTSIAAIGGGASAAASAAVSTVHSLSRTALRSLASHVFMDPGGGAVHGDNGGGGHTGAAGRRLRRAVALHLADSPAPEVGPYHTPMARLGDFMRREPQASLWLNPSIQFPKLKDFLLAPESHGVFWVEVTPEYSGGVASLDVAAIQRCVAEQRQQQQQQRYVASGANSGSAEATASQKAGVTKAAAATDGARGVDGDAHELLPTSQIVRMVFPVSVPAEGGGASLRVMDAGHLLRRAFALRLAGSLGLPGLGLYVLPLASLEDMVRSEQEHAERWHEVSGTYPDLPSFLAAPEGHGVFRLVPAAPESSGGGGGGGGGVSVFLDVEALRQQLAWQQEAQRRTRTAADVSATCSGSTNSSGLPKAVAAAGASTPEAIAAAAVAAAAAAAWPGDSPECVLRRQAAAELAAAGPCAIAGGRKHALSIGRIADLVQRAQPTAAAQLKADMGGKVQWPVVLTSNGGAELMSDKEAAVAVVPLEAVAAGGDRYSRYLLRAVQLQSDKAVLLNLPELLRRHGSGDGRRAVNAGSSASLGASGDPSSWRQQPAAAPATAGTAPKTGMEGALYGLFREPATNEAAATDAAALRCVAQLLLEAPPPHKLLFAQLGSEVPKRLGRPCSRLRTQCSRWPDVFLVQLEGKSTVTVQLVCARLLRLAARTCREQAAASSSSRSTSVAPAQAAAPMSVTTAAAAGSTAGAAAASAPLDESTAARIRAAFPLQLVGGTPAPDQPARQLRQAIATWLAGSPDQHGVLGPRRASMSWLGHHLRLQHAGLWQNPAHKFGKLRAFLESPDSLGVFVVRCKAGESEPSIKLDEAALRRAAASALAEGRARSSSSGAATTVPSGGGMQPGSSQCVLVGSTTAAAAVAPPVRHSESVAADAVGSPPQEPEAVSESAVETGHVQNVPVVTDPTGSDSAAAAAAAAAAAGIAGIADEPAQQHLPEAGVYVVADPYGEELIAMLQHCGCCTRVGLAVQAHGGRPALVSVYAPPALMQVEGPEGQLVQWPAAVYLVDPLAAAASYGGGAEGDVAAAALLCSLQQLLEAPSVAKVVHGGGGALACLEAAMGAFSGSGSDGATSVCSYPVHDTNIILASVESMLGLPHTPPAPSSLANGAGAGTGAGAYLPGSYAGAGVAWLRGLHAHVARLRDTLAGTGLWADRPQLLAALTARHFAALREDAQTALGAAGGDEDAAARVLTRPLGPSQLEVAARAARHLPELWAALVQEAVPWVALHSSTTALTGHRQQGLVVAAGADVPVNGIGASATGAVAS